MVTPRSWTWSVRAELCTESPGAVPTSGREHIWEAGALQPAACRAGPPHRVWFRIQAQVGGRGMEVALSSCMEKHHAHAAAGTSRPSDWSLPCLQKRSFRGRTRLRDVNSHHECPSREGEAVTQHRSPLQNKTNLTKTQPPRAGPSLSQEGEKASSVSGRCLLTDWKVPRLESHQKICASAIKPVCANLLTAGKL